MLGEKNLKKFKKDYLVREKGIVGDKVGCDILSVIV